MIDFANLKYLEIPEGEVIEVKRGDEILWKKPADTKPYTELLYLESTGTQYIDTGMLAPLNTKIEVKFSPSTVSENGAIFGGRDAQTSFTCTLFLLSTTKPKSFRFDRASQVTVANENQLLVDTDSTYLFVYDGMNTTLSNENTGESVSAQIGTPTTFPTKTLNIFAVNGTTNFKGRIYEWKYWNDGTLVQHLIPVLDADNTPCMFDKVSQQFFYNAGTGEFKYGEIIDNEYESIEYLESTGKEFIDTEMTINTSTDTVECVYQSIDDVKYKWIFGEHDTNARFGVGTGDGTGQRNVAYGTGTAKVGDSYIFNSAHTFLADTTGVYIDGNRITSYKSFSSTSTIYLFNLNLNGNDYCNKARIWSYKHYRNGELVREMIPVKRLLDGEAGLYDKANKMFYPLFATFNLRREKTEEEMYQMWLEDSGENIE